MLTWGPFVLYTLLTLEYWLLALETLPTVGVVELRCIALILLSRFPLGLVFEEVSADLIQLRGSDAVVCFLEIFLQPAVAHIL
jgi:hypothetical protein